MMSTVDQPRDRPREVQRAVTAAANAFLDEYVAENRNRILEKSASLAPGGETEPIRLSVIRKVLQESDNLDDSRSSTFTTRRTPIVAMLSVIALQGLTVTVTLAASRGFIGYLVFLISGIVFGGAVAVVATGFLTLRRVKTRKASIVYENAISTFLVAMSQLETKAREVGSRILRSSPDGPDLRSIIGSIENTGIWTQDEVRDFQSILAFRNQVVHESSPLKSTSSLSEASTTALRLLESLIEREQVALSNSSHLSQDGMNYENLIATALRRTLGNDKVARLKSDNADFVVEMPMGTTLVQVKFTGRKQLSMKQVDDVINQAGPSEAAGLLIVTNAQLSPEVREFNSRTSLSQQPIEVVTWKSERNDGLLLRATARLSRQLDPSDVYPEYRFQLHTTTAGKFFFRVVAPNGELIAVSEEFATRRDAARQIENLRRAASTSELDDRTGQ